MSSEMQIFKSERFGDIRTVNRDGEPWFVGKDVAIALGYSDTKSALADHVDDEDKLILQRGQIATLEIPNRGMTIINESGLYALIFGSKLPSAQDFKHWVTSEVLPSIRKHGAYMTPETLAKAVLNPDVMIQICTALKAEQDKNQKLNAQLEAQKPKVAFAEMALKSKDNVLIRQMAKLLCDNGVKIGEKRLYALLREKKVLMQNNEPYQQYVDRGYFVVVERIISTSYGYWFKHTTQITPTGQIWLTNMCAKWNNELERTTESEQ